MYDGSDKPIAFASRFHHTQTHIHFAGPYIIIVDSYTKWMDMHMTSSSSAAVTIQNLRETFSTLGQMKVIASDNGHAFTSSETHPLFLKQNGVIHKKV